MNIIIALVWDNAAITFGICNKKNYNPYSDLYNHNQLYIHVAMTDLEIDTAYLFQKASVYNSQIYTQHAQQVRVSTANGS